ncbi:MAG TPA: 50S ribosomal protein L13 [Flavobacteriales bacterium]|nr:50S ribosomal protein L13 [Flavobacteriales bacterium]
MNTLSYKTVSQRKEDVQKEWLIVDAADQVLGRLASSIAYVLKGKHKASYTPHNDDGDVVIVINADKIKTTGKKAEQKIYLRHTGYPGGQRETSFENMLKDHPERIIEKAVKGMLPRTKLGRQQYTNLYVYAGSEHAHAAQQPKEININSLR